MYNLNFKLYNLNLILNVTVTKYECWDLGARNFEIEKSDKKTVLRPAEHEYSSAF